MAQLNPRLKVSSQFAICYELLVLQTKPGQICQKDKFHTILLLPLKSKWFKMYDAAAVIFYFPSLTREVYSE
jgi:hypothetical protein